MKEKRILNALGQVDGFYIEDAAPAKQKAKKPLWIRWVATAACLMLFVAVVGIVGTNQNWFATKENPEHEAENNDAVIDTEHKEKVSLIDSDLDAEFGHLFPTAIEKGYLLCSNGIEIYGDSPRVLQASYTNTEINDTLLIRVAPNGYFGEVEYDTVMYGAYRTDGTRSSMIYYQNNGLTIMYQFEKTDIAQLDGEAAERLYAMIHSAIYFDSNSAGSGYEGNDELEDIDVPTN